MYMNDGNKTKINLRNKSVFITGVAGFIGSNLAKRLLSTVEGVKVVGLDNMNHYYDVRLKEARLNELEQFDNFSFVKGNLADKAVIESIFEQYKPEIVVNLGAQAGVRYSITNPDAYVEANLIGFYNILEACRHSYDEGHTPVEHLVYLRYPDIVPIRPVLKNVSFVDLRQYWYDSCRAGRLCGFPCTVRWQLCTGGSFGACGAAVTAPMLLSLAGSALIVAASALFAWLF